MWTKDIYPIGRVGKILYRMLFYIRKKLNNLESTWNRSPDPLQPSYTRFHPSSRIN